MTKDNPKDQIENVYAEYEIYVPSVANDGKLYSPDSILAFKNQLIERFGGLTDTKHENVGIWKIGGHRMQDSITIWRVLCDDQKNSGETRQFMSRIKQAMERSLQQEKILIVCREVSVL